MFLSTKLSLMWLNSNFNDHSGRDCGMKNKIKICISVSQGGHLDEMNAIHEVYDTFDYFFVMPRNQITEELHKKFPVCYFKTPPKQPKRIPWSYMVKLFPYYLYLLPVSLKIIILKKPDVIIGNGGEATLALSYIGKLFGIKIIYIESLTRISNLSGTGKLIYPIADKFLVQWRSLTLIYPKSEYWGKVI